VGFARASQLLVDPILSSTYLPDGPGFEPLVASYSPLISVFPCLVVEGISFWLPARGGGKKCLGLPALRFVKFAILMNEQTHSSVDDVTGYSSLPVGSSHDLRGQRNMARNCFSGIEA
jgi:hypothetical protein